MGGGNWNASSYAATRSYQKANNIDPFAYTQAVRSGKASTVHPDLDPTKLNSFDKKVRECFDSDDHPNTTPIAVLFDETGSMGQIPELLADKLTNLFGLLLRKGYCEDPQILVGGVGDTYSDSFPLQISQFEADNRVDEALTNIILEGNGGGNGGESYALAMYFMANFVQTDAWNKRGKKGYLFIVGDEMCHSPLKPSEIKDYIGEEAEGVLDLKGLIAQLQEKWELFWIYPRSGTFHSLYDYWRELLGERVLVVEDIENVCEVIGATIGLLEGAIDDLDDAAADLDEIGASGAKGTVSSALAHLSTVGGGAVTTSSAPADLSGAGASRL